jgi:hypothetical protein
MHLFSTKKQQWSCLSWSKDANTRKKDVKNATKKPPQCVGLLSQNHVDFPVGRRARDGGPHHFRRTTRCRRTKYRASDKKRRGITRLAGAAPTEPHHFRRTTRCRRTKYRASDKKRRGMTRLAGAAPTRVWRDPVPNGYIARFSRIWNDSKKFVQSPSSIKSSKCVCFRAKNNNGPV